MIFELDRESRIPLYLQVVAQVREHDLARVR